MERRLTAGMPAADARSTVEASPEVRTAHRQAAAVLVSFNPATLKPVGPPTIGGDPYVCLVDDVTAGAAEDGVARWTLKPALRRQALAELQRGIGFAAALAANPDWPRTDLQRCFEHYLVGAEYPAIEQRSAGQLAKTLRVLEWLDGLLPGLPSPRDVERRLERARFLAPFAHLLAKGFAGRERELDTLRNYVGVQQAQTIIGQTFRYIDLWVSTITGNPRRGPLVVWGPGGVGKSTVIARFVSEHTAQHELTPFPFVYLDFDSGSLGVTSIAPLLIEFRCSTVQSVQLGDDLTMSSRPQVGVDARLEGGQAQLRKACDLAVEEAVGLDVGVGVASPHRQRLTQSGRDIVGVAHGRRGAVGVLERRRVDRGVGAVHEVAVPLADDHVAEGVAEVGHVSVERRSAARGGVLAVGRLQQRVDRDRSTGCGDQDCHDSPLLRTTEGAGHTIDEDLQRAEHPVVHGPNVVTGPEQGLGIVHRQHHPPGRSRTPQQRQTRRPPSRRPASQRSQQRGAGTRRSQSLNSSGLGNRGLRSSASSGSTFGTTAGMCSAPPQAPSVSMAANAVPKIRM